VEAARGDAGLSAAPEPIFFASPQEFYDWLDEHHETDDEVYVGYWKKHTGKPSLTWSQAVDQALCFGWIDGRLNRIDDESHMQRFTPRQPKSNWSKVNIEKVAKLKDAGLMRPAGVEAFEARTEDRSGVYSYENRHNLKLPAQFEERFREDAAAWEYWESAPQGYRATATFWVVSAKKEETRERRLGQLIEASAQGSKVPQLG
jgi:uncharacterized protein YdeI (YjbR/CyaY-like superfamily)